MSCFPSLILVSPVLVKGVGDELGVEGDVREAIAVLDSADHSRPGNTMAHLKSYCKGQQKKSFELQ